jgi:serine/threonine protein kinase
MQTEILPSPTDQIREQAALGRQQNASRAGTGGLLQTGETVQGYVIQKLLSSEGGEAEIYLCTKDYQNYVLKYFYTRSPDFEILQKLFLFSGKHPDIVSYIDGGQYKERHFLILEYAEGGALDSKKPDGSYKYLPVTEETAMQIVKETINAFDICHKNGIIHRDIKPGNLFYKNAKSETSGSDILVGDFGIASAFEADQGMSKHVTKAGGAHTAGYAAPEVFTGVIGPEMDYYALGITLWVLLTGKEPFVNEKGHPLYEGQIALDTIQGKTANLLLTRSPELSAKMQKFIRGLLTVRHEKRWGYKEVSRFLAGEDVEVFSEEVRDLPPLEIAGEKHYDYKSIAEALLAHPEEGKTLVFKGKLTAWLVRIDQEFAEKILDITETYSADKRLDKGLIFVAYSLCPSLPFTVDHDKKIMSLQDMIAILETDPYAVIPYLRGEKNGLYTYFEAIGLADIAQKVWKVVKAVPENFKLIPRITVALKGNTIKPFQDGINNDLELREIEQLYNLPEYLQERTMLFIERRCGDLPAWIENLTGKNLELWLYKLDHQQEKLIAWGKWKYFTMFLQGNDIQTGVVFGAHEDDEDFDDTEDEKYGFRDPLGNVLLPPTWDDVNGTTITNRFIVEKNGKWGVVKTDGSVILPFKYDNIYVFDEERHLYQVEIEKSEDESEYQIIAEDKTILYSGGVDLQVDSLRGNPFAAVYSFSCRELFSRDLNLLKEFDEKFQPVYLIDNSLPRTDERIKEYLFWFKANGKVCICNASGKVIKETQYTGFSRQYNGGNRDEWLMRVEQNQSFGISDVEGNLVLPVQYEAIGGEVTCFALKNKKWGVIDLRTLKQIHSFEYDRAQYFHSYALEKDGAWDIYTDEEDSDTGEHKHVLRCKIKKNRNGYTISKPNGKSLIETIYIIGFEKDFDDKGYSHSYIHAYFSRGFNCFDGQNFLGIGLETMEITKREITDQDGEYLLEHFDGDQIWNIINNLKKQNRTAEMNRLVNATWEYFFDDKKDWETARRILFFVKPGNMEGLDESYDYYRACMGRTLQEEKNHEDAVEFYEEAIRLNPDQEDSNKNWYNWRCGDCYYSLKNYSRALYFFEKSLNLEPEDQWLLNRKGKALYGLERYKEAIAAYAQAIGIEGKAVFYKNRGNAYAALGMQDKADADYREAKKYE